MKLQYESVRKIVSQYPLDSGSAGLGDMCERDVSATTREEAFVCTALCQHPLQLRIVEMHRFTGGGIIAAKRIALDESSKYQSAKKDPPDHCHLLPL